MTLYRKKPTVVRAEKWTGTWDEALSALERESATPMNDHETGLHVQTIDGNTVLVPVGAYVVLDAKGYPYPCDAEIFEAGHDELDAEVQIYPGGPSSPADPDGINWYWRRRNLGNHEIVGRGEGYTRKADAIVGALGANPDFTAAALTILDAPPA